MVIKMKMINMMKYILLNCAVVLLDAIAGASSADDRSVKYRMF